VVRKGELNPDRYLIFSVYLGGEIELRLCSKTLTPPLSNIPFTHRVMEDNPKSRFGLTHLSSDPGEYFSDEELEAMIKKDRQRARKELPKY